MIGTHIGNYRIVTELGGGAMGEVYFAEHAVMGRRAAVKIIREELSTNSEMVQRFVNEARLVNRIGHPNIVQITDFGEVGSRYYIMMEMLEGETLEERLERVGSLDEPTATHIAIQIADALRAAHELGVVHRDLKPENIYLVTRGDQRDVVKVLDFGIAKLMQTAIHKAVASTLPGAIMGTPDYMSPEQCQGDEQLDHRTDVYAMGVMLYRMLTGQLPFHGETVMEILLAQINLTPRPPRELCPELSIAAEAIINKAMEKQPTQRFADMLELRRALQAKAAPAPAPAAEPAKPAASVPVKAEQKEKAPEPPAAAAPAPVTQQSAADQEDQGRRVGSKLARILVERIHKGKLTLPNMPTAARECLSMLNDQSQSMARVAAAIGRDPVIAPQVLRRAKSALLERHGKVRTIEQAVARIGARQLRSMLMDLSAHRLFESRNPAIRKITRQLWEHSVAVAVLSRAIAKRRRDIDPEVAYLAGLLHDVGKPVAASLLLDVERTLDVPPQNWLASAAWLGVINECHREVGVALARAWELPEEIMLAIARCERYSAEGPGTVTSVVCLANALAKRAGVYAGDTDVNQVETLIIEGKMLFKLDDAMIDALMTELRSQDEQRATLIE